MFISSKSAASMLAVSFFLSGCASQLPSNLSTEEKDAAIKACIEKFDNWPTRKNACINNIRTASEPEALNKNTEETETDN